ncbi:MAG: lipopeptide [Gammaproteobacteria bacterium]|nr:MAG: lipopeptide [Gammaproteobacteria bacterium]
MKRLGMLIIVWWVLSGASCGQKGDLYLPDEQGARQEAPAPQY